MHQAALWRYLSTPSFLDLFHSPVIDAKLLREPLYEPMGLVFEPCPMALYTIAVYDRLDHTDHFVAVFEVITRSSRHSFPTALGLPRSGSLLVLTQPTLTSGTFPCPLLGRTGTRLRIS